MNKYTLVVGCAVVVRSFATGLYTKLLVDRLLWLIVVAVSHDELLFWMRLRRSAIVRFI